ncbi:pbuG [Symbiodinium sp. CCMP2456]|nr:pbuG [Symbiodinium sp. CCMP2456]
MGAASQSEPSERTVVKQGGRRASMLEILGLKGNFSHLNLKDPFNVKKLGSSYTTEIRAGLTTFLAMAYILPVNSGMLSLAVPDMKEQLVCATALAAFCGCWLMGILSNFPFMLAPGMGTNAYFTFSIVLGRGLPWQAAFAAVFVAGVLFTLLSVTGMRTLLIRLFPEGIKEIIGAGVGLFLTFIAFQSAEGMGFSVADPATLVKLGSLSPDSYDSAKMWLSLAVLVITASLLAAKVPGAPLIGIVLGTVICWIEGWAHGTEGSVFGYPFGTGGDSSAKDFHIYVPTGIVAKPTLEGLAGALFEGFDWAAWSAMDYRRFAEAEAEMHKELAGIRDPGGVDVEALAPKSGSKDTHVPHAIEPVVLEDNQATIRILESGKSPASRHADKTQRINLGWIAEQFRRRHYKMAYINTNLQTADIVTKPFTNSDKWSRALELMRIGPDKVRTRKAAAASQPRNGELRRPDTEKTSLIIEVAWDGEAYMKNFVPEKYPQCSWISSEGIMGLNSTTKSKDLLNTARKFHRMGASVLVWVRIPSPTTDTSPPVLAEGMCSESVNTTSFNKAWASFVDLATGLTAPGADFVSMADKDCPYLEHERVRKWVKNKKFVSDNFDACAVNYHGPDGLLAREQRGDETIGHEEAEQRLTKPASFRFIAKFIKEPTKEDDPQRILLQDLFARCGMEFESRMMAQPQDLLLLTPPYNDGCRFSFFFRDITILGFSQKASPVYDGLKMFDLCHRFTLLAEGLGKHRLFPSSIRLLGGLFTPSLQRIPPPPREKTFSIIVGDSSLALVTMPGKRVSTKRTFAQQRAPRGNREMARKACEWPIKQLKQVQSDVQKVIALRDRPGINSVTVITGPENGFFYNLPEVYDEEMSRHAKVLAEGARLVDPNPLLAATDRPDGFHTSHTPENMNWTVQWYRSLVSATVTDRMINDLRPEFEPPVARDDGEQIVLSIPLLAPTQRTLLAEGEEVTEVGRVLLDTEPGAENVVQRVEDDSTAVTITKVRLEEHGDQEAIPEEVELANSLGVFALDLGEERTSKEAAAATSKTFKKVEEPTPEELAKNVIYSIPRGSVGIQNMMQEMSIESGAKPPIPAKAGERRRKPRQRGAGPRPTEPIQPPPPKKMPVAKPASEASPWRGGSYWLKGTDLPLLASGVRPMSDEKKERLGRKMTFILRAFTHKPEYGNSAPNINLRPRDLSVFKNPSDGKPRYDVLINRKSDTEFDILRVRCVQRTMSDQMDIMDTHQAVHTFVEWNASLTTRPKISAMAMFCQEFVKFPYKLGYHGTFQRNFADVIKYGLVPGGLSLHASGSRAFVMMSKEPEWQRQDNAGLREKAEIEFVIDLQMADIYSEYDCYLDLREGSQNQFIEDWAPKAIDSRMNMMAFMRSALRYGHLKRDADSDPTPGESLGTGSNRRLAAREGRRPSMADLRSSNVSRTAEQQHNTTPQGRMETDPLQAHNFAKAGLSFYTAEALQRFANVRLPNPKGKGNGKGSATYYDTTGKLALLWVTGQQEIDLLTECLVCFHDRCYTIDEIAVLITAVKSNQFEFSIRQYDGDKHFIMQNEILPIMEELANLLQREIPKSRGPGDYSVPKLVTSGDLTIPPNAEGLGYFWALLQHAWSATKRGNVIDPQLARRLEWNRVDQYQWAVFVAITVGSVLGVSTVSTFAESTAGVADGAKTGLASLVTGSCFLLAIPFSPIVPPLASGPILCLLGAMMCSSVKGVDWDDFQESLPAFVAMITMPFTFSIGYGIIAGLGLWISIQLLLAPLRLYRGESPMVRVHKLWGSAFVEGDEEEKSSGKRTPSTITPSQSFGEV